jgi:hypothetical protein
LNRVFERRIHTVDVEDVVGGLEDVDGGEEDVVEVIELELEDEDPPVQS